LFEQDAGVAAFTAPGIEQSMVGDGREEAEKNLNVEDAGVDGGREVLFVARLRRSFGGFRGEVRR